MRQSPAKAEIAPQGPGCNPPKAQAAPRSTGMRDAALIALLLAPPSCGLGRVAFPSPSRPAGSRRPGRSASWGRRPRPRIDAIRNVLLVSIDTCRADHLSCYGYKRPTTPNIDAVARDGAMFKMALTPVPSRRRRTVRCSRGPIRPRMEFT